MRSILFLVLSLLALYPHPAFSFARGRVAADLLTQSTILEGDATGLVEGCGAQPIVGFTYCREVEGSAADKSITFMGPPAECSRADACVFIKVYNSQGAVAWGGSIPKGQTRITVPWKTLLGADTFERGNRGFWTFNTQVFWKDKDGRERDSTSQGDIVLRVYRQGYVPLDRVENDPNFVWTWSEGPWLYRMTSGLRAYVGRK